MVLWNFKPFCGNTTLTALARRGRLKVKLKIGTEGNGQKDCLNHGWAGFARIIEEAQGCAWASQAGAVLSNPFASELARDSESTSLIMLRKSPCAFASRRNCWEKMRGCAWFPSGDVLWKTSASPLASVFSTTNPAFAQRINPCFLSSYPCIS